MKSCKEDHNKIYQDQKKEKWICSNCYHEGTDSSAASPLATTYETLKKQKNKILIEEK